MPSHPPSPGREAKPVHGTTTLTLDISGTKYSLWKVPVPPEKASEIIACYELKKRGSSDRYHVSEHRHGAECTCGDFIFRRNHLDANGCKHVRALAVFGLVTNHPAPIRGGAPEGNSTPMGGGVSRPFEVMPRRVRNGQHAPPSALYSLETEGKGSSTSLVGHEP